MKNNTQNERDKELAKAKMERNIFLFSIAIFVILCIFLILMLIQPGR